jgi:hypothetical protein
LTSALYFKGQNGLAERTSESTSACLMQKKTQYEVLYGKSPSLSGLHSIGSHWPACMGFTPQRTQTRVTISECRLLGYSEPNQCGLYGTPSGPVVFSRGLRFDERTPVTPLIEGEIGNDLLGNDPPSLDLPIFRQPLQT